MFLDLQCLANFEVVAQSFFVFIGEGGNDIGVVPVDCGVASFLMLCDA